MILRYLRHRKTPILLYITITGIYLLIAFLYRTLLPAVLYATLIIFVFMILMMIIDYLRFRHDISILSDIRKQPLVITDHLPPAGNVMEEEYQEILKTVNQNFADFQNDEEVKNTERNDYFMTWAHQIKTPISAMHLLIDETDLKDVQEQLFEIEEYVSNAMFYLRSDHISNDLVIKEYNLDTIIRPVIHHYSSLFIRKKIRLNYSPINCTVITDEKWLAFVIGQILSNSLKYTDTGSITISLKDTSLVIEDTGIGISASDLPRVFEKNYTGQNGRTNTKSSGMGLYLCRMILYKLSHTIAIDSQEGIGTKVTIHLEPYNSVRIS